MAVNIIVPSLGESVTEATVAKWHKKVGEQIQVDEILLELETDKITLEVNAPVSGIITEIKFNEGDVVAVGDTLGSLEKGGIAEIPRTSSDCKNQRACRLAAVISGFPSSRNSLRLRISPSLSEKVIPKSCLSSNQNPNVPYNIATIRLPSNSPNPKRILRDSLRTEYRLRKIISKVNAMAGGKAV